jgi:hypothetical protein
MQKEQTTTIFKEKKINVLSELHTLIVSQEIEKAKELIKKLDVQYLNSDKGWYNTLELACANGNVEIINMLLEKGVDIHNNETRSSLRTTCENKHLEASRLLLERGAKVVGSVIIYACHNCSIDIVKLLFEFKESWEPAIFTEISKITENSIISSCNRNDDDVSIFKFLLENEFNRDEYFAIHSACESNTPNILNYILDIGVDINLKNQSELTPLHFACFFRQINIVEILLQRGADILCKDIQGQTAREYAVSSDFNEIVSLIDNFIYIELK